MKSFLKNKLEKIVFQGRRKLARIEKTEQKQESFLTSA
jgi:hypothetical protein